MKIIQFKTFMDALSASLMLIQKGVKCKGVGKTLLAVDINAPENILNEVFTTYPPKS